MPRLIYTLILYLATPLIWLRLLWRARRQREYMHHLGERYGFYPQPAPPRLIWVHAVSVGETRAVEPLILALQTHWPDHRILLTGMTPTGREAGRQVFGDRVIQAYLPYDYPAAVNRFFGHFLPSFGILMETEIWPNLLAGASQHNVPVFLANARLSERSARGYGKLGKLARKAFANLSGVAAQTKDDAQRINLLGARPVRVCGNLKFDVQPAVDKVDLGKSWRSEIGERPVWLAASTREGEEELILGALRQAGHPDLLLILVPRHPQRFGEVAALLERQGWRVRQRSHGFPAADTQIWLGDSMGEMAAYYTMADVAFIGGSLLPMGGQNLIEAAACGCPVLLGPHMFNFRQASRDALAAGAAQQVTSSSELGLTVNQLFQKRNEMAAMRQAAIQFAQRHQGATQRTLDFIAERLDQAGH